jgi:RNA polymerase sigma-70 factor (ECF subfamily)
MNDRPRGLLIEEHMSAVTLFSVTRKASTQEFDPIFREHYQLVYRTAFSVTGTPEDADDVVQTIFLRLLGRESPPDLKKNPKGYFYRAALNLSLNTVRLRKRQILVGDSEIFDRAVYATDADPQEKMDMRLWEAIAELHPSAAEMLVLRYVHGYSIRDIAKLLGTTSSTVAVSLFRSRARLKKIIRARGAQS